jgi:transglutaminase 1
MSNFVLWFHLDSVGKKLYTKRVGIQNNLIGGLGDVEDITDQYKYKEGTVEERMAVLNAARGAGLSFHFEIPEPEKEDVKFDLLDIERVLIGNPFYIKVEMTNRASTPRRITVSLNVNSVYYTGILAHQIKQDRQIVVLQPYQSKSSWYLYTLLLLFMYLILYLTASLI